MISKRRLIYYVATSLDGFIARENGDVDRLFTEGDYGFESFYDSIDTIIMGRVTYEQILGRGEYPYEGRKGYVFSRRHSEDRDEHVRFYDRDPVELMATLHALGGSDIWLVGGGKLAAAFLESDLIDELRVAIHPIVLGRGRPLFDGAAIERHLELISTKQHHRGLLQLDFKRARTASAEEPRADEAELQTLAREDPSVRALWNAYLARHGQDPATTAWTFVADRFGDDSRMADELANLVLTQRKRATAACLDELEAAGHPIPKPGDHLVVLDGRGVARCVVRTKRVTIRRFDAVPASFAAIEGERDGSLEAWKADHWAYYERILGPLGLAPSPDLQIACEEFELVFGPADILGDLGGD